MATARLVPSSYSTSNSVVTVSNPSNMYTNTDSTTYATATHTSSNTNTYYLYINGFNFSAVPANAVVSSFSVKVRGYETRMATSTSYAPCLVNNTSAISGTTASTNFGTSTATITIPIGNLTWATMKGYGSNFGVRVTVRRSNKNQQGYLYIYGVEIEVTYTVPASETIYFKNNGTWTAASKVFKKVNGSWVEQSDLSNVFDSATNYVKG